MRLFICFLMFHYCSIAFAAALESDEQQCLSYVRIAENYKRAHLNKHCIEAAKAGVGSAQYSVGMAYGFADKPTLEEKYYRLAASNKSISSYLALGHILSESKPWESIYWYQRYIYTKVDGYGYATKRVSRIFERLGERTQAAYWIEACLSSPYEGCVR